MAILKKVSVMLDLDLNIRSWYPNLTLSCIAETLLLKSKEIWARDYEYTSTNGALLSYLFLFPIISFPFSRNLEKRRPTARKLDRAQRNWSDGAVRRAKCFERGGVVAFE